MPHPRKMLLVRFKSRLPFEEAMAIAEERSDEFRALPGLIQKYYMHDPVSGEMAGLYLWDSKEALDEYRESALRASIAAAYQAETTPRVEVYDVVRPLRTDVE